MKSEIYAIEYENNVPRRVHVFRLERTEQQSVYRAILSMGSFDRRMGLLCEKDANARRFWVQRELEWEQHIASDRRLMLLRMSPVFVNLPKQFHKDLWSFYQAVGWDYRKKKFI